ncbi:MAG: RCC1 domain-containing protein [Rhodospirillales bacterium]
MSRLTRLFTAFALLLAVLLAGVPASAAVPDIAGGNSHSLALASDGTVYAWGSNAYGQLGNGTTVDSATPGQSLESDQRRRDRSRVFP